MLVRYCRVTEECPQWGKPWEKRVDMMHHLQEKHGIIVNIPRRNAGRPRSSERSGLHTGSRSHRQSKIRFASIDTRIKLARRKHLNDLHNGAKKRWKFSAHKHKMPFEEWVKKYIDEQMAVWESGMPDRIAKMKAKIAKGYNAMVSSSFLLLLF